MGSFEQRLREARRQHTEAIVARHLQQLFQRLPMLRASGGGALHALSREFSVSRSARWGGESAAVQRLFQVRAIRDHATKDE